MPTLYKHKTEFHHYILTSIANKVVTFQVTANGVSKLRTAGVTPGQRFPRHLLFALYRDGDLSTAASGQLDFTDPVNVQPEFDFSEDLKSDSEFPVCDCCSSGFSLSLVVVKYAEQLAGEISCSQCVRNYGLATDFCTPLPIPQAKLTDCLLFLNKISKKQPNIIKLDHILHWTAS